MTAQLAAVSAVTEELARTQRQLEAQMATLERTSDATIKSVARASSEAAALDPLRSELKTVREELRAHEDALAKLTKSVGDLRRKIPAPERVADATPKPRPRPKARRKPISEADAEAEGEGVVGGRPEAFPPRRRRWWRARPELSRTPSAPVR